ncbi:MAG: hypothetical protein OEZ36_13355, partial [Spirochaetota bacterium]|nr:hypothetical protein [Spirochaetota bacterium]
KGKVRGKIRWIKSNKNSYLSFPQITFLGTDISGKDRYLLGYAIMKRLNKSYDNDDDSYRYPWAYYVQEIDVNGNTLTKSTKLKQSGWGEQDELVSLGMGRVAWAYIPKPTLKKDSNGSTLPSCNSYSLKLSVYKSSASYQKPKALPKSDKIYSAYQGNDNSFMTDEICKDSVLVGIKWQGRHLLDRVAGICSNKKETKFIGGQEIDKEYPMRRYVCSGKDNRVKKISVWAFGLNNAFDRIQITCSNGKSSGIVGGWGREGKRQNPPLQCPDGTYPIGISGKKGQSVDVLALVCKKGKAPKISHGVSDESSRDKVLLSSYQGDNKYDNQKALCKDSKLIGLRLHSGLIVDKIIGICSNNTSTSYLGSKSPGPKRASYTCPGQGNRIDSLSVWAFGFQKSIERIQITCKNGQRSEILGGWGNDGKLQKPPLRCPPKSYPIGISGNKGQWLKALALACRK